MTTNERGDRIITSGVNWRGEPFVCGEPACNTCKHYEDEHMCDCEDGSCEHLFGKPLPCRVKGCSCFKYVEMKLAGGAESPAEEWFKYQQAMRGIVV